MIVVSWKCIYVNVLRQNTFHPFTINSILKMKFAIIFHQKRIHKLFLLIKTIGGNDYLYIV